MKKEEIIIQCIDDIKAGKLSQEECFRVYPDLSKEIESLLNISLTISEQPDAVPTDEFKSIARASLMRHINESKTQKQREKVTYTSQIRTSWFTGWAKVATVAVAIVLFISAAGTGTAFASQSSLPGDTLYSVKLGTEQVQRIFTFNAASEVELELAFADTRLNELEQLSIMTEDSVISKNVALVTMAVTVFTPENPQPAYASWAERIDLAVRGYEKNINMAITKSETIVGNDALLELVALAVMQHLDKLDKIEDNASPQAFEALTMSREAAMNGHLQSIQNLAKVQPEKANQINQQAIQNRVERAQTEAAQGRTEKAEEAFRNAETMRQFSRELPEPDGSNNEDNSSTEPKNRNDSPDSANKTDLQLPDISQPSKPINNHSEEQENSPEPPVEQLPGKPDETPGKDNNHEQNSQRGE